VSFLELILTTETKAKPNCRRDTFAAWYGQLNLSLLAGGIVAFVEATLGWYISCLIGPGRPKNKLSRIAIGKIVLIVTMKGAALGFIGGLSAEMILGK